jgi:SAM-dependent methyltransferase
MLVENAQRHYQGEAGRRYQEVKRGIPDCAIDWVARLRAEKFSAFIKPSDTVLEYGAGLGWNLAQLKCARKIGFDVGEFLEPSLRAQGIEFCPDTKMLAAGSIDVVLCHHTLEHVPEPAAVLREILRLLAPRGKFLLYVPQERGARYDKFDAAEPNHHLYSWNAQTLGNLARENGFEVAQAGTGEFGYSRFAAVWAVKLHLGEGGFRGIRRLAHILKPGREVRIIAVKSNPS